MSHVKGPRQPLGDAALGSDLPLSGPPAPTPQPRSPYLASSKWRSLDTDPNTHPTALEFHLKARESEVPGPGPLRTLHSACILLLACRTPTLVCVHEPQDRGEPGAAGVRGQPTAEPAQKVLLPAWLQLLHHGELPPPGGISLAPSLPGPPRHQHSPS